MSQGVFTMESSDIGNLIRQHAHLTDDEIQGYVEKTLDLHVLEMVEKHLRLCAYCTKEVELLREALDVRSPTDDLDMSEESVRSEAVRILGRIRLRLGKVHLGDRTFQIEPAPGYPELLGLGENLVLAEFEDAIDEDRKSPGAHTFRMEGEGFAPVVVPMRDFRDVNDIDVEEMKLVASTGKTESRETQEQTSELELVFICHLPDKTLEVFSHKRSTALFLRLT
jgi:hypothetical protein